MAVRQQLQGAILSTRHCRMLAVDAPTRSGGRFVAAALSPHTSWQKRRSRRGLAIRVAAVAAPPEQERKLTRRPGAFGDPDLVVLPASGGPVALAPKPAAVAHARPSPPPHRGVGGRPWTAMHARLQSHLRSSGLLEGVDSVLVAVSGGQDSVCLLQLLADLRHLYSWRRLGVVHCDHRWRTDSAANAAFVVELATQRLGLEAEDVHVEVAGPGQARCERSAREWRYRVFSRVAAECGYGAVVTAHTSTDRAETMLLNLLRGAGPSGLVALSRNRPLPPPPFSERAASRRRQEPLLVPQRPQGPTFGPLPGPGLGPAAAHGPCGGDTVRGASSEALPRAAAASADCTCSTGSCMCGGAGSGTAQSGASNSSSSKCSSSRNLTDSSTRAASGGGNGPARLVRPLLQFAREETLAFVQQAGLPHFHDSTNEHNEHRRNRLRNEVMPQLRAGFNPRLDLALNRFMEVLEPEVEFVEDMAELAYGRVCRPEADVASRGHGGVAAAAPAQRAEEGGINSAEALDGRQEAACQEALKVSALRKLPLALQRRVLHSWLARELARRRRSLRAGPSAAAGPRSRMAADAASPDVPAPGRPSGSASKCVEVGFDDVARCLKLLAGTTPQGTVSDQLCGGLVAVVDGEWLRLRAARELADWQRQVQAQRRKEQLERKQLRQQQQRQQLAMQTLRVRVARRLRESQEELEAMQAAAAQQPEAGTGTDTHGLVMQYLERLHRVQQELHELEELEREVLGSRSHERELASLTG